MNETIEKTADQTVPETVEKEKAFEFRKLASKDLFLMTKIISKIGIKEFKACFEDEKVGKVISKLFSKDKGNISEGAIYTVAGVTLLPLADIIIGNMHKCERDIYVLLAQVSNKTEKEIENDAVLFLEMIVDFFKKPEFGDFLKVVSKSFK